MTEPTPRQHIDTDLFLDHIARRLEQIRQATPNGIGVIDVERIRAENND